MEIIEKISYFVLPCVVIFVGFIIFFGKRDYFSSFSSGAWNGAKASVKLLPTMCALIVGVSMFTASGASDFFTKLLSPVFDFIGVPSEIFSLILTRPISGSASLATFKEILDACGADSFAGLCASVIMASSDTVIYIICVYFSTSNIKKTRHAMPIALFVSFFCVILSCIVTRIIFE